LTNFISFFRDFTLLFIENGPKTVKLFVNRQAIDFNDAKRSEAVQTLEYETDRISLAIDFRYFEIDLTRKIFKMDRQLNYVLLNFKMFKQFQ